MKLNPFGIRNLIIVLILFNMNHSVRAQNSDQETGNTLVLNHLFSDYRDDLNTSKQRALLNTSKSKRLVRFNPLTYVASGLLFVYQNVFSEQISAVCTYEVSCSEMTKKSIEREGLIKGIFIGFHQLANCSPSLIHDHEKHAISVDDKIINSFHYD